MRFLKKLFDDEPNLTAIFGTFLFCFIVIFVIAIFA